mgnify:CR=1 FL=1
MKDLVIGVLGGMGTYATINLFKQYAEIFPAEKEWERPRIIIDNRCTMPSRVRAFLYHENVDELVDQMTESIEGLLKVGAKKIILACNTSHLFLPKIFERAPEAKNAVVNIIDSCVDQIDKDNIKQVYLLGSEGTIESEIYQNALTQKRIMCQVPEKEKYVLLRKCIEAVKQNKYTDEVESIFEKLVSEYEMPVILGCTELPILYEKYKDNIEGAVYDPLQIALKLLKKEYDHE